MLGTPPAFVLSQDQTLYKWYLSLKSVKSCFAQHAIACVLCELLCLELFNVFFQHENRFRYKFFDIVQFSRSCAPQPCGWRLDYFTTEVVFCQALFFRSFSFLTELGASRKPLAFLPDFLASIGSFRFTSSRDSEVILLSQRLALKYNTTSPPFCQHFFASFLSFFYISWICFISPAGCFFFIP